MNFKDIYDFLYEQDGGGGGDAGGGDVGGGDIGGDISIDAGLDTAGDFSDDNASTQSDNIARYPWPIGLMRRNQSLIKKRKKKKKKKS